AVQLLDIVWAPLVLFGIEKVRIVPGVTASNPLDLYYMPYTHSLVAAFLWSAAAFATYALAARRSIAGAATVAAAVFSHWVLDLVVHRPDLPLYDDTAKVGLGLWNFPAPAFGLEALVLFGGMAAFLWRGAARPVPMVAFGLVMLAIQAYVFFGPPPASDKAAAATALVSYAVFAVVIRWLESRPARRLVAA
ncbi:MAG TPA: hypothetical protein VF376_05240, partial [Thermoanaerobaculia bacterium]